MSYPLELLQGEVACLAVHLHWSYRELMEMEHAERRSWVRQVARMSRTAREP